MSNQEVITEAVDTILNTRDFCGDERQALRDVQADRKVKLSSDEVAEVWARVNGTWREHQIAAGAKILTPDERAAACRALEDDEV
jgi:hypothetical protein